MLVDVSAFLIGEGGSADRHFFVSVRLSKTIEWPAGRMWWAKIIWYFFSGSVANYRESVLWSTRNIVRSFEDGSYSYKNNSFAYISKFSVFGESCDGCDVVVHFFAGGYFSGTRYDLSPLMQYVAMTRRVQPWSIEYRLLDEGSSYDDIIEDATLALQFLRRRVGPDRKIVVLGSSSGADLALRVANMTDGIILDSVWFCLPTKYIDPVTTSPVLNGDHDYECYEKVHVPHFVLHATGDRSVTDATAREYVRRYPSVGHCFVNGGAHIIPFSEACVSTLNEWLDTTFGWELVTSRLQTGDLLWRAYAALSETNQFMLQNFPAFLLDVFVRPCTTVSPIEAYSLGCQNVKMEDVALEHT